MDLQSASLLRYYLFLGNPNSNHHEAEYVMSSAAPGMRSQRLDKWLWAARFFKTRSLSAAAIDSGKVLLNAQRVKPAKEVRCGDTLAITSGDQHFVVVVEGLHEQRRPAVEARLLYAETPESLAKRLRLMELRKLAPVPGENLRGRPTKKAGRQIRSLADSG